MSRSVLSAAHRLQEETAAEALRLQIVQRAVERSVQFAVQRLEQEAAAAALMQSKLEVEEKQRLAEAIFDERESMRRSAEAMRQSLGEAVARLKQPYSSSAVHVAASPSQEEAMETEALDLTTVLASEIDIHHKRVADLAHFKERRQEELMVVKEQLQTLRKATIAMSFAPPIQQPLQPEKNVQLAWLHQAEDYAMTCDASLNEEESIEVPVPGFARSLTPRSKRVRKLSRQLSDLTQNICRELAQILPSSPRSSRSQSPTDSCDSSSDGEEKNDSLMGLCRSRGKQRQRTVMIADLNTLADPRYGLKGPTVKATAHRQRSRSVPVLSYAQIAQSVSKFQAEVPHYWQTPPSLARAKRLSV